MSKSTLHAAEDAVKKLFDAYTLMSGVVREADNVSKAALGCPPDPDKFRAAMCNMNDALNRLRAVDGPT